MRMDQIIMIFFHQLHEYLGEEQTLVVLILKLCHTLFHGVDLLFLDCYKSVVVHLQETLSIFFLLLFMI